MAPLHLMKIRTISAKEISGSKGEPTLEVKAVLDDGTTATAGVPSGASTGKFEALELRDPDGRGVKQTAANVNEKIKALLVGRAAENQTEIDRLMIEADGTENKANLGANALVGVSMAVCRAAAKARKIELYEYLGELSGSQDFKVPQPLMLMLEGGKHGDWATDIQEYFVIPQKGRFKTFQTMFEAGYEVFLALQLVLKERGLAADLGLEGGYRPKLKSNQEGFEVICQAVKHSGFVLGRDFVLGADCAASEFFDGSFYQLKSQGLFKLTASEWTEILQNWLKQYPLTLLEDPLAEDDWQNWQEFFKAIKKTDNKGIEIVGDDLTVTNVRRIKKARDWRACNAVIIKPNQVGTLTETLAAIKAVQTAGWQAVVSHRSGETRDDFIADLCVGTGCRQCKLGGPTKPERLAKYNRLIGIEKKLSVIGQ